MDGTLLDSIRAWHAAESQVTAAAGIVLSKEERDELNTLTLVEAGAWFHEKFGVLGDGDEVSRSIMEYMLAFYRSGAKANPGAVEFVRACHEAGAPMCVLSSSPKAFIRAGIPSAGLGEFFPDDHFMISAEDRGLTKRAPETFDYVCSLLGTAPEDTWLFDDSWYALATAHDVGLKCAGIYSLDGCGTHEELARYCDVVADSFAELDPKGFLS